MNYNRQTFIERFCLYLKRIFKKNKKSVVTSGHHWTEECASSSPISPWGRKKDSRGHRGEGKEEFSQLDFLDKTQVSAESEGRCAPVPPRRRHAYLCAVAAPRLSASPLIGAPGAAVPPRAPAPGRRSSLTSGFKAGLGRAGGRHRLLRH